MKKRAVASNTANYTVVGDVSLEEQIEQAKQRMTDAAKKLDFAVATVERDKMLILKKQLDTLNGKKTK